MEIQDKKHSPYLKVNACFFLKIPCCHSVNHTLRTVLLIKKGGQKATLLYPVFSCLIRLFDQLQLSAVFTLYHFHNVHTRPVLAAQFNCLVRTQIVKHVYYPAV